MFRQEKHDGIFIYFFSVASFFLGGGPALVKIVIFNLMLLERETLT